MPTYTDLYYQDPANRGTPSLRPERAWGSEAGVEYAPSDRLRASVTLFRRDERDGIDYVRAGPADLWRAANIQQLRFSGLEAGARYRHRRQEFELHYTGLRGTHNRSAGCFPSTFSTIRCMLAWRVGGDSGAAGRPGPARRDGAAAAFALCGIRSVRSARRGPLAAFSSTDESERRRLSGDPRGGHAPGAAFSAAWS